MQYSGFFFRVIHIHILGRILIIIITIMHPFQDEGHSIHLLQAVDLLTDICLYRVVRIVHWRLEDNLDRNRCSNRTITKAVDVGNWDGRGACRNAASGTIPQMHETERWDRMEGVPGKLATFTSCGKMK